jgi:hypothetical protein
MAGGILTSQFGSIPTEQIKIIDILSNKKDLPFYILKYSDFSGLNRQTQITTFTTSHNILIYNKINNLGFFNFSFLQSIPDNCIFYLQIGGIFAMQGTMTINIQITDLNNVLNSYTKNVDSSGSSQFDGFWNLFFTKQDLINTDILNINMISGNTTRLFCNLTIYDFNQ